MKTIKLLVIGGLNEIFQSLDIKFSFVNNDLQQVSSPCKCRDFLADVIYSYKRKNKLISMDFYIILMRLHMT